ncbi:MAG: transcription-repair coupling factor [Candidatus Cloacimonetes bacterium]|nr:transcription-repair coupling factor [Candidatus Cloacimonadota bacterium]
MLYRDIETYLNRSDFISRFDIDLEREQLSAYHGLNRSTKALLVSRAFFKTGRNIILVSHDERIAEEFEDDLDLLIGSNRVFYLPDYEILPYEERSPHYSIRAQRISSLVRATTGEHSVYSVSLRSFLRKIVHPEIFIPHIIKLDVHTEYKPEILISDLVAMGYENEFQVVTVGNVARRGGIIDVFSPGTEKPIRLEFMGDAIESIRVFSVSTQRSTGEELNSVVLMPSREFSLHDINTNEKIWKKIHKEGFYEGIEQDVSLLLDKTANFIEFFSPADCIIAWDEIIHTRDIITEILYETTSLYQARKEKFKSEILPHPDKIFAGEDFLNKMLTHFKNLYLSASILPEQIFPASVAAPFQSQENLHGNLDLLEKSLHQKIRDNYRILIQSDNSGQSKRMRELLPQFEEQVDFTLGVLQKGFILPDSQLAIYTDHEIFSRYKKKRRKARFSRDEALVDYESLQPGDYIVHIDHGIGIYAGLTKLNIDGNNIECLHLKYAGNDSVYVPTYQLTLVSRYVSEEGFVPTIHRLGGRSWETTKTRARKQVELVAEDIVKLYAERKIRKGISFEPDTIWQKEMEDSFIYEDTPDQTTATIEIKDDMEQDIPMERLLCGDVGFGKTEVAIRAAFKAVNSGWQVAILVPTTLLAEQHYLVFKERLAQYPIRISMFSRFRSPGALKKDLVLLTEGVIDIAIGTHRLLSRDVVFKKLGLLIIDEEHRFGVRHKEKLRKLKSDIDTLYMSATPIPRTMYMTLSRLKELSLIRTSPKERLPIRTMMVPFDKDIIKDAINREIDRGGQVFFVHNRVQTIDSMAADLKKLLPEVSFGVGHGQMPEKILERVTLDFAHHKFDVLIATTIIESGIDIPNCNTIIINRADTFGLAQLYQIRGRVGRSNRRAYAYLIIPQHLNEEARKRLETLIEYESLGSGYQIAMRDMEIRGVGTLLGTRQSGIINTIGFHYYNYLLEEAVKNVQAKDKISLIDQQFDKLKRLQIESDFYFPDDYIHDEKERLSLYRKMLTFTSPGQFDDFSIELTDRFGNIPTPGENAILYYKLNMLIGKTDIEAFQLKKGIASLQFSNKMLPSRTKLEALLKKFSYPVSFSSLNNLRISLDIDGGKGKSRKELLRDSMRIIEFIINW